MFRRVCVPLITLMTLFASSSAHATGWSDSFPAVAASSHLDGRTQALVVIAAGDSTGEAQAAATALAEALKTSARFKAVKTAEEMGPLLKEADPEIVTKAGALSIDTVLIVRVFPSDAGTPPTAVVTIFAHEGSMLGAMTTTRGVAIEARAVAAAGAVLPEQALRAVSDSARKSRDGESVAPELDAPKPQVVEEKPKVDPNKEYDEKFVSFPDAPPTRRFKRAFLGTEKEVLRGSAFYRAIGREDLASSYSARGTAKNWIMGIGITAAVVGAVMIPIGLAASCEHRADFESRSAECTQYGSARQALAPGIGLVGGGALLWVIGFVIDQHPVNDATARKLADHYNRQLRLDLGLPPLAPAVPTPADSEAPADEGSGGSIGLMFAPGGMGIGVRGTM